MSKYNKWHNAQDTLPSKKKGAEVSFWVTSDTGDTVFFDFRKGQWFDKNLSPKAVDSWRYRLEKTEDYENRLDKEKKELMTLINETLLDHLNLSNQQKKKKRRLVILSFCKATGFKNWNKNPRNAYRSMCNYTYGRKREFVEFLKDFKIKLQK